MIRQQTYRRNYTLPSVVLLAFIVSAAAGVYGGSGYVPVMTLVRVLFFVAVAAALAVSLKQFGLAFALLPLIAAAVPVSIGTGTQSPIVAGLLFACVLPVLGVVRALTSRRLIVVNSSIYLPIVALMLVWSIAYLYSDVERSPMVWTWNTFTLPRLGQLGIVLVSAVTMIVAVNVGSSSRWIQVAVWTFVGLGVICLMGFYPPLARFVRFVNTGGLFTMWLVALAYGQALFNDTLRPWLRVGLVALVLAWIYRAMFLQTIWFSGWLPSVVALAVITLIRSRRLFGILLMAAVSAVLLNFDQVYHALWDAKIDEGDLTRIPIWAQAFDLTRQHLLLGTGPAGYAAYYTSVYAGSAFSMSTHSDYVDIVLETGLVGTVIFLWLIGSLVVVGWHARRQWHSGFESGFSEGAFGGLVGLIVAMQLGDWFIPFVYNQTIVGFQYTVHSWVFLGFLAALALRRPAPEGA